MALTMSFYETEENITEEILKPLQKYYDNKTNPSEISMLISQIKENSFVYKVYRIAKMVDKNFPAYKIEDDVIIPEEGEFKVWETHYAYIKLNSKSIYVSGSGAGWVSSFISNIIFKNDAKIKLIEINTKGLEEDIRKSKKFTPTGASFVDEEQTKVTIKNPSGLDFVTNKYMKDISEIDKDRIDIIIQKDDLNIIVFVYPQGKVTFQGYTRDKDTTLRIFLKIWNEIKEYH